MIMLAFEDDQNVIVIVRGPLQGKRGRVWRVCLNSDDAWVKMDEPLPESLRSFPPGDSRCDLIKLAPECCEPA